MFCNLLQKIPIYFGPKQWKCPFCEKVMTEKGSMKKHIMLHTGGKPYSCQFCDLKCNRTYNLKAHIRNKHSDIVMFWSLNKILLLAHLVFFLSLFQKLPIKVNSSQWACPVCSKVMINPRLPTYPRARHSIWIFVTWQSLPECGSFWS